ncbi:MAG: hypothetical protein AAGA75_10915 [Cyanobacteria bacterium P01_E01_bin.6]
MQKLRSTIGRKSIQSFQSRSREQRLSLGNSCPEYQIQKDKEALLRYLEEGVVETWESEEIVRDAKGRIIKTINTRKRLQRGILLWAIERILGPNPKSVNTFDAIQVLLRDKLILKDQAKIIFDGVTSITNDMEKFNRQVETTLSPSSQDKLLGSSHSH